MIEDFHFIRPLWFLATLPGAALLWMFLRRRSQTGAWRAVCDERLLPYILRDRDVKPGKKSAIALGCAGILSIAALAGPTWERLPEPVFRNPEALVIALDLSASMNASDAKPSRLGRARFKIADLLNLRKDGQTALIVFATRAYTVTPLTDDVETINAHLPALTTELMPTTGSDPRTAIEAAVTLLQQAGATRGDLLLVTDGLAGVDIDTLVEQARAGRLRVSVLGAGSLEGAPIPALDSGFVTGNNGAIALTSLEESELSLLAARTNGKYQRMTLDNRDFETLQAFFETTMQRGNEQATELHSEQWREAGPWLVMTLLPFAMMVFRRGRLVAVVLALHLPFDTHAQEQNSIFEWSSLWLNADQRGYRSLREGQSVRAGELFEDPEWKAVAQYRAGDYASAAETLTTVDAGVALYNRGNALARLGRYNEAIEHYKQILTDQPDHEDAKFNHDLLQNLLQQQQPEGDNNNKQQQPPQGQQGSQGKDPQPNQQSGDDSPSQRSTSAGENNKQQNGHNAKPADDQLSKAPNRQLTDAEQQTDRQGASDRPEQEMGGKDKKDQGKHTDAPRESEQLMTEAQPAQTEEQQATQQWLRRIPDDPGRLLRQKFLYQYRHQEAETDYDGDPW